MFLTPFFRHSFQNFFWLLPSHSGVILCSWQLLHTEKGKHQREFLKGWRSWWASLPWTRWPQESHFVCLQQGCKCYRRHLTEVVSLGSIPAEQGYQSLQHQTLHMESTDENAVRKKLRPNLTSKFPSELLDWVTKTSDNCHAIVLTKWRKKCQFHWEQVNKGWAKSQ